MALPEEPALPLKPSLKTLTPNEIDRIIEMAWEDRTPFDAIFDQFSIKESEVRELMKRNLRFSSYKRWRQRVEACQTKHRRTQDETMLRFKSKLQRHITRNKISKRYKR